MNISALLAPERVACHREVRSKKKALETLSDMLATADADLDRDEVFDSLLARERLGSTGMGHGVAIPHGRMQGLDHAVGAALVLDAPVDYEAPDGKPVDVLFALLVPEESTQEHLQILASLARVFSDPQKVEQIRACRQDADLLEMTGHWPVEDAA
ncbi:MAG: PTS sugar transporter subunit IIA [Gammaproteobacteria bacterium]|nr:MAG: PTS sugar transporter subunit IIA [Gammaproteobacteria bacterium]